MAGLTGLGALLACQLAQIKTTVMGLSYAIVSEVLMTQITMVDGWAALRALGDELAATHADPFAAAFFEEHWDVIVRILRQLTNAPKSCQISR